LHLKEYDVFPAQFSQIMSMPKPASYKVVKTALMNPELEISNSTLKFINSNYGLLV
jgi:hypothetical protein